MKVVFDANFLVYLLTPPVNTSGADTDDYKRAELARSKIAFLLDELGSKRAKILIPTPVLAELFTRLGSATTEVVKALQEEYRFEFADFDVRAAMETGLALGSYKKKKTTMDHAPWQKVKYDRQIVSIAKVNNAEVVYSNDKQVRKWSEESGLLALSIEDLKDPPSCQMTLDFTDQEQGQIEEGELD